MDDGLKQRLVGAMVLVALGVLFIPVLFRPAEQRVDRNSQIPPAPDFRQVPEVEEPVRPANIEPAADPDSMYTLMDEVTDEPAPAQQANTTSNTTSVTASDAGEASATSAVAQPAAELTPPTPAPTASVKPQAPPKPTEVAIPVGFAVQVVSLSSADKADALKDRLIAAGYRAFVRSGNGANGMLWRVFVGPVLRRDEAETIRQEINKAMNLNTIIVEFKP